MTEKLAVSPSGAADLMSVAERRVWAEIKSGRLRSFKIGRRRLIRVTDIDAFLERRALLAVDGAAPRRRARRAPASAGLVPFPELEAAR